MPRMVGRAKSAEDEDAESRSPAVTMGLGVVFCWGPAGVESFEREDCANFPQDSLDVLGKKK